MRRCCCCCGGGGCKGERLGIFFPVVGGAVIIVGVGDDVGGVGDNVYQLVGAKGRGVGEGEKRWMY